MKPLGREPSQVARRHRHGPRPCKAACPTSSVPRQPSARPGEGAHNDGAHCLVRVPNVSRPLGTTQFARPRPSLCRWLGQRLRQKTLDAFGEVDARRRQAQVCPSSGDGSRPATRIASRSRVAWASGTRRSLSPKASSSRDWRACSSRLGMRQYRSQGRPHAHGGGRRAARPDQPPRDLRFSAHRAVFTGGGAAHRARPAAATVRDWKCRRAAAESPRLLDQSRFPRMITTRLSGTACECTGTAGR